MALAVTSAAEMLAQCETWQTVCGLTAPDADSVDTLTVGGLKSIFPGSVEDDPLGKLPCAVVFHEKFNDRVYAGGSQHFLQIDPELLAWVFIDMYILSRHEEDFDAS